jgi:thiol-disulfide isomerase/thioredoxin
MRRCAFRIEVVLISLLCTLAAAAAELPTAQAILKVHQANKSRLSRLHLQLVHIEETTEAFCLKAKHDAQQQEQFFTALSRAKREEIVINGPDGKPLQGAQLQQVMSQLAEQRRFVSSRTFDLKPTRSIRPMEFFTNGVDYQFRSPLDSFETVEQSRAWKFSNAPVTPATLLTTYRNVSIFSRAADARPAARSWHDSAGGYAYVMQKRLDQVASVDLPPFTDVTRPQWANWHPYDAFFSQAAEKYRVVRQDQLDGHLLTVVEVAVPMAPAGTNQLFFRAWLDLKRGAIPLKMLHSQGVDKLPDNFFDRVQVRSDTTTHAVRELRNGAYYPAKTVCEDWDRDPDQPEPTDAQRAEIRDGKRKLPTVVHRRHTWDCALVNVEPRFDADFFILRFPEGQILFDHDAGKVQGALDPRPLAKVGQEAPPLTIARWLDGKPRTLDDLRGQVVVLDFWGLWCSACRTSVPQHNSLQDRFKDRPVTFISIHTADQDQDELAAQIKEFAKGNGWQFIAAIDQGKMLEDSVTTNAYGIDGFPMRVIIGPDGKIAYVDPASDGPTCDETDAIVLAEFEKRANEFQMARFDAVGETWPPPKNMTQAEQVSVYNRVDELFIAQQIENALRNRR